MLVKMLSRTSNERAQAVSTSYSCFPRTHLLFSPKSSLVFPERITYFPQTLLLFPQIHLFFSPISSFFSLNPASTGKERHIFPTPYLFSIQGVFLFDINQICMFFRYFFRICLVVWQKVPTFASAFENETLGALKEAIFDKIYIKDRE